MTDTIEVLVRYRSQDDAICEFVVDKDPSHGECACTACEIINQVAQHIVDAGYPPILRPAR